MSDDCRLFCFGLGASALALISRLAADGFDFAGTTRDGDKAAAWRARGIDAIVVDDCFDVTLDGASHVLVSIPPSGFDDLVLRACRDRLVAARPGWIGYLSTTGVYGNRDGGTVDEGSALRPTSDCARARVQAELAWLRFGLDTGIPVHIFRLAGIYGPGRSVLDQLRAGQARRIDKPGHLFSRIHVDDIAAVLAASIARPRAAGDDPGIYNVCDDEPAEPREVVEYAAGLLGIDPPPLIRLEDAGLGPMARSFWADNKRVANHRIKDALGVRLAYPTYREGLRAILAAGG